MNEINHNELTVNNNRNLAQYEIRLGDTMIGPAAYQQAPNLIVFTHTEVNDEFEGAGVGSRLIRQALEETRAAGFLVLPLCPFVQMVMSRHAEYAELDCRGHRSPTTAHD